MLVIFLVASTACDASPPEGSALDLGRGGNRVCVPAPDESDDKTMFGDTWLRHVASAEVTITGVSLVGTDDMELDEAVLVEIAPGEALVGMRHASTSAPLPAAWEERVPAEGAVVAPGQELNLVLVVGSRPDDTADADAARIEYEEANGRQYQQQTRTSMLVSRRPCDEALSETAPDP